MSENHNLPRAPWTDQNSINERKEAGLISILGPNGERICDIFPFARRGGIGADAARAVAEFIMDARNKNT